jgi:hypothetical protein
MLAELFGEVEACVFKISAERSRGDCLEDFPDNPREQIGRSDF